MSTSHTPSTYIILAPCRPWVGFSRSDGVYVKQPPEPLVFTTPVWSQRQHEASNRYNHTRYSIAEMNGQYGPHGYHSDRADLSNTIKRTFDPRVPSWTSCQSYRPHYDHRIAEAGCPELQMQIGLGSLQARSATASTLLEPQAKLTTSSSYSFVVTSC
ncbi:hypothetical protein BCR33DRAFT_716547 [Rhizoclosmatium globosum]|uniref:Uncharacterized protein n=1 Tax=Rhizoclosmatium globosum TaxID=329046 RepID=A0A1Y2CED8_9FUNG|nr:hypothetical protein BCR33DRAFT_716547 [Rhizoclosmatium globosum]|eukprot:ORY45257.1 hypothetical protein BCR33DRAFT_716547 [Rhizoclosmatium globosum]